MMPQKEVSEAIHQQADPDYGRYEGKQTASARQHSETSNEQDVREGPSGKVYPLPRDNTKILSFALVVIALGLLLLFGLLFVVVVGGTAGWISFAAACVVILTRAGVGIDKIHEAIITRRIRSDGGRNIAHLIGNVFPSTSAGTATLLHGSRAP